MTDALAHEHVTNVDGLAEFERPWRRSSERSGRITIVLRIKNEARNLGYVLPPLLRTFDSLVIADNLSTDGTLETLAAEIDKANATDRVQVLNYPVMVARCGSEHRRTAERSVQNLTHFYNWTFSHASDPYTFKWDGDMVLTQFGEEVFRQLQWRIAKGIFEVSTPIMQVWVKSPTTAYVDTYCAPREPRIKPNLPEFVFTKGLNHELAVGPPIPTLWLQFGIIIEVKRLDEDEFSHWTSVDDFSDPRASWRKQREFEISRAGAELGSDPHLVEITDPDGDVVDRLRRLSPAEWQRLRPKLRPTEAQRRAKRRLSHQPRSG